MTAAMIRMRKIGCVPDCRNAWGYVEKSSDTKGAEKTAATENTTQPTAAPGRIERADPIPISVKSKHAMVYVAIEIQNTDRFHRSHRPQPVSVNARNAGHQMMSVSSTTTKVRAGI